MNQTEYSFGQVLNDNSDNLPVKKSYWKPLPKSAKSMESNSLCGVHSSFFLTRLFASFTLFHSSFCKYFLSNSANYYK